MSLTLKPLRGPHMKDVLLEFLFLIRKSIENLKDNIKSDESSSP